MSNSSSQFVLSSSLTISRLYIARLSHRGGCYALLSKKKSRQRIVASLRRCRSKSSFIMSCARLQCVHPDSVASIPDFNCVSMHIAPCVHPESRKKPGQSFQEPRTRDMLCRVACAKYGLTLERFLCCTELLTMI